MSHIGKLPINIPDGVDVNVLPGKIIVFSVQDTSSF